MAIIYRIRNNKNILNLFMHHQKKLIKGTEKERERNRLPLAWACSSLWKDILGFKKNYSILFKAKNILLTVKKFLRQEPLKRL